MAILVTRERVAVSLLDQLDTARMESPAGMLDDESKTEGKSGGDAPNPQRDGERDDRNDGVAGC